MASLANQAGRYLDQVKRLLVKKAKVYGNSAGDPVMVFSKATPIERLNQRIDEKLSRFARGTEYVEDTEDDLIGLLALRRVLMKRRKRK